MTQEGRINHPDIAHIDFHGPTEWARAEKLHAIGRFGTIEQMTHRTSVLVHSIRVANHANLMAQVLMTQGIWVDQRVVLHFGDHHDDVEMVTGDKPTPEKRAASEEERRIMDEEDMEAAKQIDYLVQRPTWAREYPEEFEEYRSQRTLEARVVNYADKWDGLHEAVHEVVCGENKEQFKQVIENYRKDFEKLDEANADWQGHVKTIFGDDFFDFPEPEQLVPKKVDELDYSSFSTFLNSLTVGNPSSYRWWLRFNHFGFKLDFLEDVFPGWMEKFPKEVLADIRRVKTKAPYKMTSSGLLVPSDSIDIHNLTFGEGMNVVILSSIIEAIAMVKSMILPSEQQ